MAESKTGLTHREAAQELYETLRNDPLSILDASSREKYPVEIADGTVMEQYWLDLVERVQYDI